MSLPEFEEKKRSNKYAVGSLSGINQVHPARDPADAANLFLQNICLNTQEYISIWEISLITDDWQLPGDRLYAKLS